MKYCEMCDRWLKTRAVDCSYCGATLRRPAKLTRQEKEEGLADRGTDTLEEYREER